MKKSELIPEELEIVWDSAIAEAFKALRPKQQDFLLEYLRTGNAAAAYRKAYNPLASDHLASVCGSQVLASSGISGILAKFENRKTEALFRVTKTFFDLTEAAKPEWVEDSDGQWQNVGDVPDWKARKDGADGLCKIYGLNAPEKVQDDRLTALLNHMHRTKEESNAQETRKPEARRVARDFEGPARRGSRSNGKRE